MRRGVEEGGGGGGIHVKPLAIQRGQTTITRLSCAFFVERQFRKLSRTINENKLSETDGRKALPSICGLLL